MLRLLVVYEEDTVEPVSAVEEVTRFPMSSYENPNAKSALFAEVAAVISERSLYA